MLTALSTWIPKQRWFNQHLGSPAFKLLTRRIFEFSALDGVQLHWLLLQDLNGTGSPVYQIPLLVGASPLVNSAEPGAVIAGVEDEPAQLSVLDATRHPLGRELILRCLFLDSEKDSSSTAAGGFESPATTGDQDVLTLYGKSNVGESWFNAPTKLLAGEQSNSSIIVDDPQQPGIVKLFRVLIPGENPDVSVHRELNKLNSRQVATLLGESVLNSGSFSAHAAFAVSFFKDVEDAWRVALDAAGDEQDFDSAAARLGKSTALMHRELATAFGTQRLSAAEVSARVDEMLANLDQTADLVPEVDTHAEVLRDALAQARTAEWGELQRVHGDFHLGQVLDTADLGWVVLDFEGEPLRPLNQRLRPESVFKDVAGMVRSLDYVAGSLAVNQGLDVSAWVASARRAFLRGYVEVQLYEYSRAHAAVYSAATLQTEDALAHLTDGSSTPTPDQLDVLVQQVEASPVFVAFEIDKALYEARYEAAQRPDWLQIPLRALTALAAKTAQ